MHSIEIVPEWLFPATRTETHSWPYTCIIPCAEGRCRSWLVIWGKWFVAYQSFEGG